MRLRFWGQRCIGGFENEVDDSQNAIPGAQGCGTMLAVRDRSGGPMSHGLRPPLSARRTEMEAKIMQVERIRLLLVEDNSVQAGAIKATLERTSEVDFQVEIADRLSAALE